MLGQARALFQEAGVTQLVELVVADGLNAQVPLDLGYVGGACGQSGHARAGEGDLRRGAELQIAIGVARLAAGFGDIEHDVLLGWIAGEMVHGVGVVPEDAEIVGGALHGGEAAHRLIGVGDAGGVRVLRHAPDALDCVVGDDEALHFFHIGAVLAKGDGNHLDAEIFANREVTVVAGDGAEPFHLGQAPPGRTSQGPEHQVAHHGVVHGREARIAEHDDVLWLIVQKRRHEPLRLGDAVEHAVVAAVGAVLGGKVGFGVQHVQHRQGQLQLCGRGLAAGHVQLEAPGRHLAVAGAHLGELGLQFRLGHLCIARHIPSFRRKTARLHKIRSVTPSR